MPPSPLPGRAYTDTQTGGAVENVFCVQLPTLADNVALPAFAAAADRRPAGRAAIDRYLLANGRRAHSSKPAKTACGSGRTGQTDRRTDGRPTVA